MHIDLERLRIERDLDPFTCPPIDIMEALKLSAGLLRDSSLANPEIMAEPGVALSRVLATNVTPRMRFLLAVMGFVPLEPATDDVWILDEPIPLPSRANALVAAFTARYYAEGMTLLFSPDDGMFEGKGLRLGITGNGTASELRGEVKAMAERQSVALRIVFPFCPPSILHHWIGKDVERVNPARIRCGLPELRAPSKSTVQRWCREFEVVHRSRPGVGAEWRSYDKRMPGAVAPAA